MKRIHGTAAQAMIYYAAAEGTLFGEPESRHCDIGPEPHEYSQEEAKAVARQIAEQRKHKRRRR